jgi:ankyrin repeat protein
VKIKKLDIHSRDFENSTPLHWACIQKLPQDARLSIMYLLAMGANPNLQDHEGNTALHLAVKAAQKNDSTLAIRQLLLNRADRSLTNHTGKTAFEYATLIDELDWREVIERTLIEGEI